MIKRKLVMWSIFFYSFEKEKETETELEKKLKKRLFLNGIS